jgi:FtsZ-interacting cell division protein ZipA
MNWPVLVLFGIAAIALIVFLVWKNIKDEKQVENQIKQDYRKHKNEEGDTEIDEVMK